MEKEFDLSMCRVIVDNAEQSKKLQELAFKQGFNWWGHRKTATNTHEKVLYFNSETSRITFSDLDTDDSGFKTFHFTDVFKETLQEKVIRLENELKEVKQQIEEENKPKPGDWCKFWGDDKSRFIVGKLERFTDIEDYPYCVDGIGFFKNCMKITDENLLKAFSNL